MDYNENIYIKELGKTLFDAEGLGLNEVVGEQTGEQLGATFFRGKNSVDGLWASPSLEVVEACIMPVGYGAGDHRLFVMDFKTRSLLGAQSLRTMRQASRRLSNRIEGNMRKFVEDLKRKEF